MVNEQASAQSPPNRSRAWTMLVVVVRPRRRRRTRLLSYRQPDVEREPVGRTDRDHRRLRPRPRGPPARGASCRAPAAQPHPRRAVLRRGRPVRRGHRTERRLDQPAGDHVQAHLQPLEPPAQRRCDRPSRARVRRHRGVRLFAGPAICLRPAARDERDSDGRQRRQHRALRAAQLSLDCRDPDDVLNAGRRHDRHHRPLRVVLDAEQRRPGHGSRRSQAARIRRAAGVPIQEPRCRGSSTSCSRPSSSVWRSTTPTGCAPCSPTAGITSRP